MTTIWKYTLALAEEQHIDMPEGAQILDIQIQKDLVCLWALVDTMKQAQKHTILTFGTGHPIDAEEVKSVKYIASLQFNDGDLVFHYFEKTNSWLPLTPNR